MALQESDNLMNKPKSKPKPTPKRKELCSKQFDFIYDIIAAIISLFDIITDIWILIEWYYQDRMVFFAISLIILILANFAYVLVFNIRYGDDYKHHALKLCFCTCCSLPLAPFLSFIFYFLDTCDQPCCCFNFYGYYQSNNDSKSRRWMESKLSKHIGFLMEAIMEAFPQSILQMMSIIYFNEVNMIAIISIIISMLSVSCKSLIFSAAASINIKTMIFTWCYAVTDFFAIFFVLSFVFYNGNDINDNTITIIHNIWLYKMYVITIPTCFICSIPIFIWGADRILDQIWNIDNEVLAIIIASLFVIPLWALGMILGTMMLEILCYSYFAYLIYKLCHGKIPSNTSAAIWIQIINWIQNGSHDTVTRICCVNRELLLMKNNDVILYQYLEKKEHSTQYLDVKYGTIRQLYGARGLLRKRYAVLFEEDGFVANVIRIFLSFYGLSRIITLLFPFCVITVIMRNGQSIIYDLPLFQMVMLFVMLGMILIMIILLCIVYSEERIIFYILPLRSRLYAGIDEYLLKMIISYYERLIIKPLIRDSLCNIFGNDIGLLMFEFMPFELEEEEHAKQLTLKAAYYTKEIKSNIKDSLQDAMFRADVL